MINTNFSAAIVSAWVRSWLYFLFKQESVEAGDKETTGVAEKESEVHMNIFEYGYALIFSAIAKNLSFARHQ